MPEITIIIGGQTMTFEQEIFKRIKDVFGKSKMVLSNLSRK